ncbi:MAG: VF530 family DNA-binding protein, partial [Psychromonas sp.]|nr:VF530 family DNA-binding protein [Psychromonas sp.]
MREEQQNNPLHGLKLETLLTELVDFYGWDILATAMRFNCFKTNPSIKGSLPFLRKTTWAREKLEAFYLYRFKRMPKPDTEQYQLPPRERTFAVGIVPREPMILTQESIALSQAKAASAFKSKSSTSKKAFTPYHKSNCDRGQCAPKS